ncbi:hypothetical protein NEUTE1DRAFT_139998 [Neurospora tetrasperma FGSC 2508]|uniref:Cyanovirin-N domain-containing protein n=1 Tax=Neurospora tetrasperma (strain FGSC 2508 / ATCC MYA-4615 / P0657) TaxID=510951 RepID=F8MUS6_NEUT8|nr:uncharacterized protein NEUTE1DRAFT_139998 [Neurospora tetrasperma FGSC 2508]EGO55758.1 hypothetical protein NEUTE1DRAFT_139998 [Neurospora tetrasperma FGSC 2508]EGZ68990.1 hypothetical protein NEUTE2DRAFT_70140 [Neurospora tetrasperma FGSC 2509]
MHELSILSALGISLLASFSFTFALAHPTASASPNPIPTLSRSSLVTPPLSLALTPPLPHNNDHSNDNNEIITGNFSRSCAQITLMNGYFLAATCRPIKPADVSGGPEEEQEQEQGAGEGDGISQSQSPEFNQLDLNLCIGFDQGTTTTTAGGGGGFGSSYDVPGKLIWQALGKFANYCTDCNLTTTADLPVRLSELKCSCVPMTAAAGSDATVITVLDLDEGVENRNGTLVCRGGMGSGIGPGPFSA